ncbi:nitrate reductase [NADH]-like [Leptopilina heterotoma]|uniref:nitrate reductase [NADH]-like n=1 Tax=Leptopilina heterotoma TaxID=63436 RepID=UPI001CA9FB03|nr:nitrate reductase [NADH]-like [Leptopilina heterotoma]
MELHSPFSPELISIRQQASVFQEMSLERHLRGTASSPEGTILDKIGLLRSTFRALDLQDSKPKDSIFIQQLENERTIPVHENKYGGVETKKKDFKIVRNRIIRGKSREEEENLQPISLDEVAWHDTTDDCWIVVYDYVYDCTDFVKNHPGGQDIILEYAGRDATLAFIGTGHSKVAKQNLERYLIGELPLSERIFRTPDGVKIVDF